MHRHLIAVEVCVECSADKWVNLDCLAFDQHRFKRLDTQTMKRRSAVQKHWMLANYFLENIPDHRFLTLNHFACLLDGGRMALLLELVVDEWLKQFERHLLRQAALMQFQLRTDNDY